MKKLLAKIRKILKDRRTRQLLTRIVSITAAIVVFVTTYALVLPAITMESEANCGIPAHQHDDSCYEDRLICGQVESPGHQHTDSCYSISKSLICTETEHQHDDSCFDADGNLTCELAEHTHDDSCYEEVRELVCDIPESEGHEHTDDCYERVLACGMEAHTHSTACYSHGSELTASAPSDFAAVATTELGSYGATVSASAETDTNSEETSNTWASDESAAGGLSSTAAGAAATDYSSTATAADTASTGFDAATAEDAFVPQLEPIIFEQLLTKDTGIYYYHAEEGEEVPENSVDIADWKRVNDDTELAPADLLRVYLRYTIPAGALNATNDIARYRLPSNLHLTDQQMEAINITVNGIANQYVNLDTLEITDTERYNTYLGIEATEGTRKPSDNIDEYFSNHPDLEGQEYINAVVRAENVFDETTEEYLGQDLVFTFTPYTVQKNQHEYDADGQPTKAGQKVNGWLCFDLHMDQIDWSEPVISTIEDPAAPAQDVATENTEDTNSSDITEATGKAASDMDEDATLSSSNPDELNTNTITEKKESSAEIVFAAKDEIRTEIHLVEFNTIEKENDAAQDEPDQSADESTDNANSEMTDGKDDIADDSNPEGEADKPESANEPATDTENQPESAMEINAETYPAVSFEDTITVQAGTLSTDNESAAQATPAETAITVSVIAEEETFPLGTTMQLGTVEDMDTVASAVEGAIEGQTRGFHAVDISFHNADGEEIEPLKPIKVSMTSDAIKQAVEDSSTAPVVVHVENSSEVHAKDKDSAVLPANSIDTEENSADTALQSDREAETSANTPIATIVETNEPSNINGSGESTETADTLSFDAGAFSVYAIVYTVDFEYSVNGKMYQFSLPGGGFVSFTDLIEVLGIIGDTNSEGNGDETESVIVENAEENAANDVVEENSVNFDTNTALTLGDVEVSEATRKFVADVASVEFSTPSLVDVSKVEADTTVGQIKEGRGLECEYSAELTEEQIADINAQTINGGDWALISLKPFDTEETLTVTMKNGDEWTVKLTDAQEVTSSEASEIDINKAYIICYDDGTDYHILHNDGSQTQVSKGAFDILAEYYASNTTWAFQHVFKEYDREGTEGYNYYLIRSNDDISSTLAIYEEVTQGEELIQPSSNNVAVLPAEGGGFYLSGYNGYRLAFENGKFVSKKYNENDPDTGSVMHIFERETLPQYMLTVRSNDPSRGVVWCYNPSNVNDSDILHGSANTLDGHTTTEYYKRFDVLSDSPNTGTTRHIDQYIYALYFGEEGLNGTQKYKFDHWELNGEHLDPEEYPWRIPANSLPVPYNGSELVAHFVYDDTFQARDDQKTDSSVEDMSNWLSEFMNHRVPLDESATQKTAEVYDYENRIYRVDLTTKSNLRTFDGNIDLGFSLDVSNSMKFPADLQKYTDLSNVDIRAVNGGFWDGQRWHNGVSLPYNNGRQNGTYYLISDASNRSTVFRIQWRNNQWEWKDASKADSAYAKIDSNTRFHADTDATHDNNYTYQLYYANPDSTGNVRDRFYYLNQSISSITDDLVNIKNTLNVAGASSPSVKVGYNTFNGEVADDDRRRISDVAKITPAFQEVAGGGTRPDRAMEDAESLGWSGNTRYLILITDGAPQGGKRTGDPDYTLEQIRGFVRDSAEHIKENQNVKIITIGLSMKDVEEGRKLLYDIADYAPDNGPKMFYLAEKTQDLTNILRQILDLILVDATVQGDITDTVNEAFYLVDKQTGLPLSAGDTIDIEGKKTADPSKVAGTVLADGKTVKWNDQTIDSKNGWHGVVYVKAKEDLIGANAAKTNDSQHPVEFLAEKYYTTNNTTPKTFSTNEQNKLKTRVLHEESPRVNVNELTFPKTDTEWTVYLGTNVDPKTQIQKLYENVKVEEVVNTDNSLHYSLSENDIRDARESGAVGTAKTFPLAPVILENIKASSTLRAKYIKNNELDWGAFLSDILKEDGVAVPYHPYGIEGEDSRIVISLSKEILSGEEADIVNGSLHNTTVVNGTTTDEEERPVDVPAEKYTLTVKYFPDYDNVLPKGQGGTSTENFHTGAYGTGYQGHAAGTETSTNNHEINVYAEPLDVQKHDDSGRELPGATFKLYRATKDGEQGVALSSYDESLTGSYYCISTATSDEDGIAHLAPDDMDTPTHIIPIAGRQNSQNLLVPGETYYLIETSAPNGYKKDGTVRVVTVEAGPDLFTKLDKTTPVESANISGNPAKPTILYNWNEGVTIKVTELGDTTNTNKATLVNHETREAVTLDNGRTYMLRSDSDQSVVTQVIVINGRSVDIRIKKTDMDGTGLPGAVFRLKSVNGSEESEVSNIDGIGTVTKEIDGEMRSFESAFETSGAEQILSGLSDGTYRLYEVYIPDGYIGTFRYVQFDIEDGALKNVTTDTGSSDKIVPTAADGNSLALIQIKNEPGAELPHTGGLGTTLLYIFGALLTIGGGAGMIIRKRKRAA